MSKQKLGTYLYGICLCVWFFVQSISPVFAFESTTLYNGSKGEDVRELQQALIDLGYLNGSADGIFGNKTENAVRKFQKSNKLTVDGLAGSATRAAILNKAQTKKGNGNQTASASSSPTPASASEPNVSSSSASGVQESSSLFGNYSAIHFGDKGDRVKSLQQSLITLGFLNGKPDGIFGNQTKKAVKAFQRSKKLSADGIAGKKTLAAIQTALSDGSAISGTAQTTIISSASDSTAPVSTTEKKDLDLNDRISAPSSVQLLHWFNDVKPSLTNGQYLLVYDPSSGLSWTLRVMSRGRHCDSEPLTAQDTRTMIAAFGGINTWNQKAVYVKLPDGRWSLASTHDMPHDSSTIKNNNFNGHLCVHFLRDMDEAKQNDPNYGVANQETIRAHWKQMTGEDIP